MCLSCLFALIKRNLWIINYLTDYRLSHIYSDLLHHTVCADQIRILIC